MISYVIILIIFFIYTYQCYVQSNYLIGSWVNEDEGIILYFGNKKGIISREIPGYLYMGDSNVSQGFVVKYWWFPLCTDAIGSIIEFDDEQIFDKNVQLTVDMFKGTLKFKTTNDEYLLYKRFDI